MKSWAWRLAGEQHWTWQSWSRTWRVRDPWDFSENNSTLAWIEPVHVLVDVTPLVDEGQVVFVHQVLEQEVHQACEVGGGYDWWEKGALYQKEWWEKGTLYQKEWWAGRICCTWPPWRASTTSSHTAHQTWKQDKAQNRWKRVKQDKALQNLHKTGKRPELNSNSPRDGATLCLCAWEQKAAAIPSKDHCFTNSLLSTI